MKIQSAKAGIGTGRAGLQAASGLFSSAGLFQKGVKSFNPLDLDPYLLFDAETSMLGTLEAETLDLDPANPSSLDVITATRSGVATRTLPNGTIATAPANTVRVDYTQGEQLTPTVYQYFQTDFSSVYWTERDSTITSGFSSPDGGNNAFKLVASQANGDVFASVASGNSHTKVVSVFAKANTATSKLRIQEQNYTGKRTEFDLNLGTITYSNSSGTSTIENIGDGWYRCAHVETYSSGQNTVAFAVRSVTADSLFLFGPQAEEGTTPTTFAANTTGSAKFITGATFGPRVPMILVEPSATNLVPDSNTFLKGSPVVRLGTTFEAPDGTNTAEGYGSIPATSGVEVSSQTASISPNTQYVSSVWVKGEAGKTASFYAKRSGGTFVQSNFVTVTLTGEWQRVTGMVMTTLSDNTGIIVKLSSSTLATQADEVYLWGAQVESGSVSTSVIPTSGSAVTRAADDLVISGSSFSDFYNASEGTFYVESVPNENTSGSFLFDLSFGNASTERLAIYNSGSNQKIFLKSSGTTWSDNIIGNRPAGGVLSRAAISFKTNNIEASIDGANMTPDTSATMSTTINKMTIGNRYENPNYLNGRIRRLIFWPTHSDSL